MRGSTGLKIGRSGGRSRRSGATLRDAVAGAAIGMSLVLSTARADSTSATTAPTTQAATTQRAAGHHAIGAMDDAAWNDLLARLASGAYQTRAKAQDDLAHLPTSCRDALKGVADAQANPEVKARLQERVSQMDDELLIDPPPIAFHVKHADLQAVAAELKKETGLKFQAFGGFNMGKTITYDTDGKPFWEVLADLQKQAPLTISNWGQELALQQQDEKITDGKIAKGFVFLPDLMSVDSQYQFHNHKLDGPALHFRFRVLIDPRINVLARRTAAFEHVVDDSGHTLEPDNAAALGMGDTERVDRFSSVQVFYDLTRPLPAAFGRTIKTIQGTVRLLVQSGTLDKSVPNIDTAFRTPISVGNVTVQFHEFRLHDGMIDMQIETKGPQTARNGFDPTTPAVGLTFTDAAGESFTTSVMINSSLGGGWGGSYKAPLSVRVSVPTGSKWVAVPFEFDDVPVPTLVPAAEK
jgi:hypothetical protein